MTPRPRQRFQLKSSFRAIATQPQRPDAAEPQPKGRIDRRGAEKNERAAARPKSPATASTSTASSVSPERHRLPPAPLPPPRRDALRAEGEKSNAERDDSYE